MSDDRQIPTPQPADRPTFTVLSNGSPISAERQVQSITVERVFDRIAFAELRIFDGDPSTEDFPVSNADEFVPGAEIEIKAGYHSEEATIFKGVVIRHGVVVHQSKPALLRVECRDLAVKLAVGRKCRYFYESTDAEVIEEIAGDAGLTTDVEATDVTHQQMVQHYATDWDFIVARAQANGKLVATNDGELVVKVPDPSSEPVAALKYGGNLLAFEALMDAREQFAAVQSSAWDQANQEQLSIDGSPLGAGSPGNLSNDQLADVIGLDLMELKHPGTVIDSELQAWADSQLQISELSKVRGRARTQGFSSVLPGSVVELAGVGERFNGSAIVNGVRHSIDTRNWETHIEFGMSPEWFHQRPEVSAPVASGLLPGISGLHIGIVTALEGDPNGEDRIQVALPMIDAAEQGVWARVAKPDAGDTRGIVFLPEIQDEVVLGFLNNDPRHPVVLGALHSSAKASPLPGTDDNHEKGIVTRSEMKILFNDDAVSLTIETPNGNTIVISDDAGGISVTDENDNKIVLDSGGITIESASDVNLKASGDVNLEGTNVNVIANAQLKGEGSAGAELSSGGSTTVKGAIVQIN